MIDRIISWFPQPKKSTGSAPEAYERAGRVALSPLFDEAYYLLQAAQAGDSVGVYPQLHYVNAGHRYYAPHPRFHLEHYRKAAGLDGETVPLLHYLEQGAAAGLCPDPTFSPESYLAEHPSWAGGLTPLESALHYDEKLPAVLLSPQARAFCFEHGRYLYALAVAFHEAGCRILLEMPSDVSRQRERFPLFESLSGSRWVTQWSPGQALPEGMVCLTDCPRRAATDSSILWKRSVPEPGEQVHLCPFPMHAGQYLRGNFRHLQWLRTQTRTTTVFFSGASGWVYRLPYFKLRYRMASRTQLLSLLAQRFGPQIDALIAQNYRLHERSRTDAPIVIAEQRKRRSPAVLWMEQLAHSDFFLCLPGAYVPIAHNIVEAMAVGAIPILAYPHYLHPRLEDGVNCLTYSGTASFVEVIEKALGMPEAEKAALRQGAMRYYDAWLSPATWARKLVTAPGERKQLYFPYEACLKPGWADSLP